MVKKKINEKKCIRIKKPVLSIQGTDVLMDRYWFQHMEEHINEIDKEIPVKEIYDSEDALIVEFKTAKLATMYRLKYGNKGQ